MKGGQWAWAGGGAHSIDTTKVRRRIVMFFDKLSARDKVAKENVREKKVRCRSLGSGVHRRQRNSEKSEK